MGVQAKIPAMTTSAIFPASIGADWILYGPIETADYIFPTVALVDAAYAHIAKEEGNKPSPNHPYFKIA